jgi:hypothetical protein
MRLPTFTQRTGLIALVALTLAACSKPPEAPNVSFAPYDKNYQSKLDLAQVDYKYPIATAELAKITPDYLAKLDQEQLDQLYARLTAGPTSRSVPPISHRIICWVARSAWRARRSHGRR